MITGLNHITLTVSDLACSLDFYKQLGFVEKVRWNKGAYLSTGNIWLCLNLGEPKPSQDYSHIAFSATSESIKQISTEFAHCLWQPNSSEGESLYLQDPDGHKLELHHGDLDSRLKHLSSAPYPGMHWPKP